MATVSVTIHLSDMDKISARKSGDVRWIWLESSDTPLFASDDKMRELRAAIDDYLAMGADDETDLDAEEDQ